MECSTVQPGLRHAVSAHPMAGYTRIAVSVAAYSPCADMMAGVSMLTPRSFQTTRSRSVTYTCSRYLL